MSSFAKITRPVLSGVFPRERLFSRLDGAISSHPIAWIGAPAGSGKTMLAASFVKARGAPCLWCHIDARDADPPSFFYYLREAAGRVAPRARESLPLLTPEYALDLEAYARSFFEQLGARLRPGTILVFDDYHELPEDAPLQRLMPVALTSLPVSVRVVVASRAAPPPAFARLVAHGRVASLAPAELNLTDEETEELARVQRRPGLGAAAAARLRARTGGWVAGTILLLERSPADVSSVEVLDVAARGPLFEYFASEILDRAPPSTRTFLLETALLPQVSARAAVSLTGEERSEEILADLVRRNYFTLRLAGPEPQYRYHPLFHAFLRARARRVLPGDLWSAAMRRAIDVLRRDGAVEDAAALMIEAADHAGLAQLVVEAAPALVRQGRLATVEGWLRALPADALEGSAWLSYWLGVCRSPFSPTDARPHLERAYRLFEQVDDPTGMLLAWSSYAKTFVFVWDRFAPLDRWIAELEALRRRHPAFPSVEIEAEVTFGMMAALMWRQAGHPERGAWVQRAAALLHADLAPEFRMQLAVYLALHGLWWTGDVGATARVLEEMRPLLDAPDVTPHTELMWHVMKAAYHGRVGERDACYEAVELGLAKAARSGVAVHSLSLLLQGVTGALASGDLEGAARYHRKAGEWLGGQEQATTAAHHHLLGTWIALCAGDLERAREHARGARQWGNLAGCDFAAPWVSHTMASLLVEEGSDAAAIGLLERCIGWSRRTRNPVVEHHCLLSVAHAHLSAGREDDAVAPLREAMALGRAHGFVTHPWIGWRRDVMSRLAALALEHGMEPAHVGAQIRAAGLAAPAAAPDAWPFAVRIHTLGAFEVWLDGERLSFPGRAQRKPLALLKVLVAHGGRDVREDVISDALWPDAEGDAARHALETTLYRLRKLLGTGVVHHRDRRLSLDPGSCWADAVALQRAATAVLEALEAPRSGRQRAARIDGGPAVVEREIERIARLYRGPFLAEDRDDLPWAEAQRERLRRVVARVVVAAERQGAPAGLSHAPAKLASWLAERDPDAIRPVPLASAADAAPPAQRGLRRAGRG